MRLQICTTCRKTTVGTPAWAPVRELVGAAKQWAKMAKQDLEIEEVNCLSGCAVGLAAMIEDADAAVRLHSIVDTATLKQVLQASEALLRGQPAGQADALVLSRTDWAEWRD